MDRVAVYQIAALLIFAIAVLGLMLTRHLLRKIVALNVMATSVFLVLVSLSYRSAEEPADPVPQAMVLTGIVVSFSATALAIALTRRLHLQSGRSHLPEETAGRTVRDEKPDAAE